MSRPTRVQIDNNALLHNLDQVRQLAPSSKVIAMVKANAYGCGIAAVLPVLEGQVDAFGVACLEEAIAIRKLGLQTSCVLFEGIFSPDELILAAANRCQIVIHQAEQLHWLLTTPLTTKLKIWIKVNTGMHRLGFDPQAVNEVIAALLPCPWVDEIALMTHLACADEPERLANQEQLAVFSELKLTQRNLQRSIANSAAILALKNSHADFVRPGIMLYGVSPFAYQTGQDLGLRPVMSFISAISAINNYPAKVQIGYGGTWETCRPSTIAVIAAGYGDGYPRHIQPGTPVWVNGYRAPIVGRVSMDMLTIDVTDCPGVELGAQVELWGSHLPVEMIARSAGTIAYELLCQLSPRVRQF